MMMMFRITTTESRARLMRFVVLTIAVIGAGMVSGFFLTPGAPKNVGAGIGWLAGTLVALCIVGVDRLREMSATFAWVGAVCLSIFAISAVVLAATYRGEFTSVTGILVLIATVNVLLALSFGLAFLSGRILK